MRGMLPNSMQRCACCIALLCLATSWSGAIAKDECDGPVVKLLVQTQSEPAPPDTYFAVLADFGGVPPLDGAPPVSAALLLANPRDACGPLSPPVQQLRRAASTWYLVERGNCSFSDKYSAVLAVNGSGMLLYDDVPGCVVMGHSPAPSNGSSSGSGGSGGGDDSGGQAPPQRNVTSPPAASLDRTDGLQLAAVLADAAAQGLQGGGLPMTASLLLLPPLDPGAGLLWAIAVGTVLAGSLWSGADYAAELRAANSGGVNDNANDNNDDDAPGSGPADVLDVTPCGAVAFVFFSSGLLLLLYWFMSAALLVALLAMFALAAWQALAVALVPVAAAVLPLRLSRATLHLPARLGRLSGAEAAAAATSGALTVTWLACRGTWAGAWLLQDSLAVALLLLVLRSVRLPSVRVACVLLPLCLVYDVWWVFLQPAVTAGRESVMVVVASGAGGADALPLLLRVPRLSGPAVLSGGGSLLGFGDVIIPGLLCALTRRLALTGWSGAYFAVSVVGYGAGLGLTYVALACSWFGPDGQPALLYLVPCTLGSVLLLGAARRELSMLLAGSAGSSLLCGTTIDYEAVAGGEVASWGTENDDGSCRGGGETTMARGGSLHGGGTAAAAAAVD